MFIAPCGYCISWIMYRYLPWPSSIYVLGIWAEDDEQDDSNRSSFGFTKSQKDTAPLRFVSGGVTIGNKRKPPDVPCSYIV